MNVLIACEYSGTVRDAFTRHGHFAVSADLLPTEAPGPHYVGDVLPLLDGARVCAHCGSVRPRVVDRCPWCRRQAHRLVVWDMMVAHPPCTYLTGAGEWLFADNIKRNVKPGVLTGAARAAARTDALRFVEQLWRAPIPRKCIENPVGVINRELGFMPAPQWVQPYQFGENASKKTGLWLDGLDRLTLPPEADWFPPRHVNGLPRWGNQTDAGQNRVPPSTDRWKIRSTFWPGIANAMADQWG